MSFVCSLCNREIDFEDLAYVKSNVVICVRCFPKYYVKSLCQNASKRALGKRLPSCEYCQFVRECDEHVKRSRG